jgi:hypothetical protein
MGDCNPITQQSIQQAFAFDQRQFGRVAWQVMIPDDGKLGHSFETFPEARGSGVVGTAMSASHSL